MIDYDVLQWCLDDMIKKGIKPLCSDYIKNCDYEQWVPFMTDGDKGSTKSGRIKFFTNGGYCACNWKLNLTVGGNINAGKQNKLTKQELAQYKREQRERAKERIKLERLKHLIKADEAKLIYNSTLKADVNHGYLVKKEIKDDKARIYKDGELYYKNWLVIPLYLNGAIQSLQFISPKADKRFLSGAKKKGCYGLCGDYKPGESVILAEGYATAQTLHQILNQTVFFGLDAGNLTHALKSILEIYPTDKVLMACDLDESEIGVKSAIQAMVDNDLTPSRENILYPELKNHNKLDWNDFVIEGGSKEIITTKFN